MTQKLKRDQLAPANVKDWRKNFKQEMKETFNLQLSDIILQKETYKTLTGENENRIRVYLGLEKDEKGDGYVLCAFAVSAFLLGSGDVYVDYETPVFKLTPQNENYSDNLETVIASIKLYRDWRKGTLEETHPGAPYRQYIYPNAYLLTKFELHELFNVQDNKEITIEFGISKTMNAMLTPAKNDTQNVMLKSTDGGDDDNVYDYSDLCPPVCDDGSVFNPS